MENNVQRKIPIITVFFVSINILIWIIMEISGDTTDSYFMLEHGASYLPYILEDGEWWRLFTAMFLHFGADHLVNNMLILGVTGIRLEHTLGKFRFCVLYLASGLCGNVLSLYKDLSQGDITVSAGASGAVFGVVGGLIAWAIWHRGRVEGLTTRGLLLMAALSLSYGFFTAGVDNWGHIGGLIGGFILGCVYAVGSKMMRILRNDV